MTERDFFEFMYADTDFIETKYGTVTSKQKMVDGILTVFNIEEQDTETLLAEHDIEWVNLLANYGLIKTNSSDDDSVWPELKPVELCSAQWFWEHGLWQEAAIKMFCVNSLKSLNETLELSELDVRVETLQKIRSKLSYVCRDIASIYYAIKLCEADYKEYGIEYVWEECLKGPKSVDELISKLHKKQP